ncbi:DUF4062 domain-containing protein [Prodigiosinella confusarubida]|uniref:DUF4062 domain-containing protein n=1 Tax=Serratia sp. (strain ATCC 39006) TaxID=104623 RepID=A0A2I5TIQ9_SERS3|nr:DUF4062 domain-containing protein [Serratia sp. ATCC 39006]AUH00129.1 DUF4062 domain-containing protein [Serratia sp. ATCC 39006]AUH04448.1 DUF4062 domain-containing protein [Serratia sp. ATCC 39006]
MNAPKRYQIFISSTYSDLIETRKKISEHILSMNHIPAGMEMFSANGKEQWNTIQKSINNSDYYILIIGERYGSISEVDGISFTEKEYRYAREIGLPTLCFIPDENYQTTRANRESDLEKIKKLNSLIEEIKGDQLCSLWNSEDDLIHKVSAALYKIFTDEPRTGWIRGDSGDPEVLTKLVNAMEENSHLKKQIQQLEESNKIKAPIISFHINDIDLSDDNLVLKILEPDDLPKLKLETVKPNFYRTDVPEDLTPYIYDEDITHYNERNPSAQEVDEYNSKMKYFEQVHSTSTLLQISNGGEIKANNLSIKITFPDAVEILDTESIKDIKKPSIYFPASPIDLAIKRKEDEGKERNIRDFASRDLFGLSHRSNMQYNHGSLSMIPSLSRSLVDEDYFYISDDNPKVITGRIQCVRQDCISTIPHDFKLIPLKKGEFKFTVSILCDEFSKWNTREFTLKII